MTTDVLNPIPYDFCQKMGKAFREESVKLVVADRNQAGLMERALHQMKAREKFAENREFVDRGSLVTASGDPVPSNENAGEQIIDPRTPQGFGNPFFR